MLFERAAIWPLVCLIALAGCSSKPAAQKAEAATLRSPADELAAADLEQFLAVVAAHGGSAMPEFTPPEETESLDHTRPASELVAAFRQQFRELFDPSRQGDAWSDDQRWADAFTRVGIAGPQFAALVRSVSCAIMRVRLDARVDVERLVTNARAEVADIASMMDAIDAVPEAERTKQDAFIRAKSALRLARGVALLEFSEMVRQVPPENCALVRRYSPRLKPLLPPAGADSLLNELQALGRGLPDRVLPAGHVAPADE